MNLLISNEEGFNFYYPSRNYLDEMHFTWIGFGEDNEFAVNGACALLYKVPLPLFLTRHKLWIGDYVYGNYEVKPEDEVLSDYVLSEDYTDAWGENPMRVGPRRWLVHMVTYQRYEIEREYTNEWAKRLQTCVSPEWYE